MTDNTMSTLARVNMNTIDVSVKSINPLKISYYRYIMCGDGIMQISLYLLHLPIDVQHDAVADDTRLIMYLVNLTLFIM